MDIPNPLPMGWYFRSVEPGTLPVLTTIPPPRRHPTLPDSALPGPQRETCRHGHPWIAANLYYQGHWAKCRICLKERQR